MRVAAFLLLAASCFASDPRSKGCGPLDQEWSVSVKTIKDFQLPIDESHSTVVFVNEVPMFNQQKIGVDGEWRVVTKRNSYAAFQIEPGQHHFCLAVGHHVVANIPLTTEPGKTYFLDRPIRFYQREEIEVMTSENGQAQLANLKVSLSHPRN